MQFNWSPGIGDPTPMGWLTVLLYAAASLLCWYVSQHTDPGERLPDGTGHSHQGGERDLRIWLGLAVLLLALGINKQLDLQTALTEAGRMIARAQGWYDRRGPVQLAFVVALAGGGLALAIAIFRWTRGVQGPARVALIGAALLMGFVVIRAASFHHFDQIIDARLLGLRWNWILEIGGIAVIIGAGLAQLAGGRLRG